MIENSTVQASELDQVSCELTLIIPLLSLLFSTLYTL